MQVQLMQGIGPTIGNNGFQDSPFAKYLPSLDKQSAELK